MMDKDKDLTVAIRIVYGAGDQANNDMIDRKYDAALQYRIDNFNKSPEVQAYHLGTALWLTGDYEAACERWLVEIERLRKREAGFTDGAGGVIDPALLWWASGHDGFGEYLKPSVAEIKKRLKTKRCQQSTWPGSIARFIVGELGEEELIEIANTSHPHPTIIGHRTTQAWFYASGAYLHASKLDDYFECLNNTYSIIVPGLGDEWHLARYELEHRPPPEGEADL